MSQLPIVLLLESFESSINEFMVFLHMRGCQVSKLSLSTVLSFTIDFFTIDFSCSV